VVDCVCRYGTPDSAAFRRAQRNFILSVAGSSVATYILQVKDRHNGNVMITDEGHLLHIDFGFIFETSPGANMRFESANFKLTEEMVEVRKLVYFLSFFLFSFSKYELNFEIDSS
jgi:phosphatidylinositol 4-kinase